METLNESENLRKKIRLEDFICRSCQTESTNTADRLCGLCKAIGKSAEPQDDSRFWQFYWFQGKTPEKLVSSLKN
jgi:hypothetical protein